jgi:hypothetical protein
MAFQAPRASSGHTDTNQQRIPLTSVEPLLLNTGPTARDAALGAAENCNPETSDGIVADGGLSDPGVTGRGIVTRGTQQYGRLWITITSRYARLVSRVDNGPTANVAPGDERDGNRVATTTAREH